MKKAIVIGAGISGIAAAMRLEERGIPTEVFEGEIHLGGRIGTRPHEATEIDLGGRNFTANDAHLLRLLAKLGVAESTDYRFNSVSVGTRRAFDMRTDGPLLTQGFRFVKNATTASPLDLLRIQNVVSGARKDDSASVACSPYWIRLAERHADPTAAAFFGRRLSDQVLRPWTLRMMASEPDEVYLGNLGPLLGRQPGPLKRVRGGMGVLMKAVRQKLDVKSGHRVLSVEVAGDRVIGITGTTEKGDTFRRRADVVVVATPAPNAADLLRATPRVADVLRQIVYRPVATVVAQYTNVAFPGAESGFFMPRSEVVSHIAKYDDTQRMRFSFAGVAARRAFVDSSVEDLLRIGEDAFRRHGGSLEGRGSFIGNVWYPGLCAHTWMHHRTVESLRTRQSDVGGLVLAGDYFRGNSLEACAKAAEENVDAFVDESTRRAVRDSRTRASSGEAGEGGAHP